MPEETKHFPLWSSLIELVTDRILLVIIYVRHTVTAESYYLKDQKNMANRNH